ncbi:bacteriohemerythrin [Polaromonas naphthalenivorans]|uniref:Hemerythrin-like metal-binding protein n=1 Tax=Polaromonas naphthalenivorans (strain CJ2) TaxID=365044 RepID=A1VWM1_POLNA|nr:hemerythrin domain-containing protein [Polaromonas naphthalenivorans]ABM40049.1 hemerythrin-like metal-binding protein [Polaromonas naphthalenivorans CJ2]
MMKSSAAVAYFWEDKLLIGHEQMDDEHQAFAHIIQALLKAPDNAIASCLADVIAHATQHFAQEDEWMCNLDFPARQCHMDEHAAVLRSAAGVKLRVHAGDHQAARLFSQELAAWLPPHVQHLDSALAAWICKLAWNAKPLVFHRQSRTRAATAIA